MPEANPPVSNAPQQSATTPSKPAEKSPYDALDEIYQTAVDLRATLTPYRLIMKDINAQYNQTYREQTVRRWFMQGGICFAALEYIKNERAAQRKSDLEEVDHALKDAAVDAIGIIKRSLNGEDIDPEKLTTARDVLDRTGYPKTQRLDANGKFESDGLNTVALGIKAILERRAPALPRAVPKPNGQPK
ncbi:MAG: hypothetical protein KGI08_01905 [Thaumarchaeota archaeon]|nr:hypothetical protein [Nitrososphaerota archaeon]